MKRDDELGLGYDIATCGCDDDNTRIDDSQERYVPHTFCLLSWEQLKPFILMLGPILQRFLRGEY